VSLGRVAGYIEISTLADNAAYDGMTLTYNGGSLTYTPESGANLKDGASVSKDGLQDLTTLTGFPSSLTQPPWVYTPADIGDNKLPGLPGPGGDGAAIDMPEHLRSSATYNSSGDGVDNGKLPEPGGDDADAGTTDSTLSAANEFSGDGTEDNPWLIGAPADLALLAELVNTGAAVYADAGKHYKLMNDISLADYDADDTDFNDGKGWIPIGQEEEGKRFRGVFDGNGHKITDLYISDGALDCAGLFGYVSGESTESRAEVKNLGVYGEVSGVGSVGGVAGVVNNNSTIENSYATGPVSGNGDVGGVAGVVNNNSTIENSYATGPVSGNGDVGGVAGCVLRSSTIENCYATGAVNGTGYNVGGVAGYVDNSTIENCYATGAVNGSDYVGGVAGYVLNGNVTSCAALNIGVRTSSASDAFIGRAVGESYSSVLSGLTAFNETPVTYSTSTTPKDITEGEATMAGKDGLGFTEGGREGADGDVIEQGFLLAGFWTGVMGWDENVWSFADDRLPVLKDVAGYVDDDNLGKQTGDVGLYASGQHIEHAVVTRGAVTGATGGDGTAASPYTYVYNGNKRLDAEDQAKLGLTVKFGDKTLEMQEDYVLSRYKYTASGDITDPDRTNVTGKDITLTVAGRKNYTGIADAAVFRITPKSLAGASVTVRGYYYYNGWAWTPANVAVALDGEMLEAGKDYTLSYSSNVYAGEAKVAVTGTGNYKDTAIGAFTIFGAYDSGDKTSEQPAAEQVDITFDANGGEVSGKPLLVRSVKSGSKLGKLSIPTRNGHKFSGWYTKRTGGKKISASTEAPSKDSTYYAHWEKIYGKAIAAVNVRKSPNEKAPAVGRIKKGQTFEIRRFIDNPGKSNDWYVKKHKGKTAYLPARYVEEV
jgi:uncharacterized repeat protein (TIGR02543 family)